MDNDEFNIWKSIHPQLIRIYDGACAEDRIAYLNMPLCIHLGSLLLRMKIDAVITGENFGIMIAICGPLVFSRRIYAFSHKLSVFTKQKTKTNRMSTVGDRHVFIAGGTQLIL